MIEKERLEKLIKAEETIYTGDSDVHLLSRWHFVCDGKLWESHRYESEYLYDLEELFETEEEAEWFSKFGNITRTGTLSLPTWEEFVKIEENGDYGFTDIKRFDNVRFGYKYCPEKQTSALFIDKNGETLFYTLMVTKENYIKACELCRKLFLGEEV